MGICILNYLNDWLVLAQSEVELFSQRSLLLSNFAKSALSPSQRISFLGTVFCSAQMRVAVTQECALAIQRLAASFVAGASRPLKSFQRMLDLMVSVSPVLQLDLLRMRPLQRWLKPRVPSSRTPANQGEQVISLSALPPSDEDQELKLLYSIRAVKIYLECSALFRQLDQLFVCYGNRTKGRPVTK